MEVLSEFETTAAGAAMMALYGKGIYASLQEASEHFVKVRMIIRPERKNYETYQEFYQMYQETYKTLKPLFPKRMALTEKLYSRKKVKVENL